MLIKRLKKLLENNKGTLLIKLIIGLNLLSLIIILLSFITTQMLRYKDYLTNYIKSIYDINYSLNYMSYEIKSSNYIFPCENNKDNYIICKNYNNSKDIKLLILYTIENGNLIRKTSVVNNIECVGSIRFDNSRNIMAKNICEVRITKIDDIVDIELKSKLGKYYKKRIKYINGVFYV